MSADDWEYPKAWLVLPYPEIRHRIIVALATVAHDPATGLNWPTVVAFPYWRRCRSLRGRSLRNRRLRAHSWRSVLTESIRRARPALARDALRQAALELAPLRGVFRAQQSQRLSGAAHAASPANAVRQQFR